MEVAAIIGPGQAGENPTLTALRKAAEVPPGAPLREHVLGLADRQLEMMLEGAAQEAELKLLRAENAELRRALAESLAAAALLRAGRRRGRCAI